jgi:hypothetical protein
MKFFKAGICDNYFPFAFISVGLSSDSTFLFCGEIRIPDPRIRSPMLYRAELRAH